MSPIIYLAWNKNESSQDRKTEEEEEDKKTFNSSSEIIINYTENSSIQVIF
jgi:hypothetical protein